MIEKWPFQLDGPFLFYRAKENFAVEPIQALGNDIEI